MNFNTILSTLISPNCDLSTATPEKISSTHVGSEKNRNQDTDGSDDNSITKEETRVSTSLTQVSLTFRSEDPLTLTSNSTDLSPYLRANNVQIESDTDGEDDDVTIAESLPIVGEFVPESCSQNVGSVSEQSAPTAVSSDDSTNGSRRLIRSNSFTLETPSFKDLPSCDSVPEPNDKSCSQKEEVQSRSLRWNWASNPSVDSLFARSPVVSNKVAERALEVLRRDEIVVDFEANEIEQQVRRLKDMQITLIEYHSLQLDHLKIKQRNEIETLQTQITCMEKILSKLKSQHPASLSHTFPNAIRQPVVQPSVCSFTDGSSKTLLKNNIPISCSSKTASKNLFDEHRPVPVVLKEKFGALIKGYLVRRLLKTGEVQKTISTIRDVRLQIVKLHKEVHLNESDCQFGEMLFFQLRAALKQFQSLFFELPLRERMRLISADRSKRKNILQFSFADHSSDDQPKKLSSATIKRLASKQSLEPSKVSPSYSVKYRHRKNFMLQRFNARKSVPSPRPTSSAAKMRQHNLLILNKIQDLDNSVESRKPWR